MTREIKAEILDILDNVTYWNLLLPEDYKGRIETIKKYLNKEVSLWVCLIDKQPPLNTEILAKDTKGKIFLTTWRSEYGIFSCQGKRDSVYGWVWKEI